tara:strand:- start:53187 stop:53945 length:759 start_codon:yes stop_codon:yes gene_type:complete
MKNLTFLTALLLGGLLHTTGCIITDNGDDDDTGGRAPDAGVVITPDAAVAGNSAMSVAWTLDPGCPEDTSAAEVIAQNQVTDEFFTDIYDCLDGGGTTAELPLGSYDVWVEITNSAGDGLFAVSNAVTVVLDTDGAVENVTIPTFLVNDGFFGLTWSLVDTGGTPLTCAEVFSGGVDIVSTKASTSEALVDVFDCEAGEGVTAPLPIDAYTIVVEVLNENDAALGTSEARDVDITFGNELVDLGNFEFTFSE